MSISLLSDEIKTLAVVDDVHEKIKVLFSCLLQLFDDTISLVNCKLPTKNSSGDFLRESLIEKIAGATRKITTDSLVGACLDNCHGYLP